VSVGIFVAIALSLVLTLYRASRPHTCVLGRTPGTVIYRDASRFRKAMPVADIIVFRFDGIVFFGNTNVLREELQVAELDLVRKGETLKAVILDATAITTIDYQGIVGVRELVESYAKREICAWVFLLRCLMCANFCLFAQCFASPTWTTEHWQRSRPLV
jgi:MFS superfamily sulfate permease-like transporter